jgi:tetratricopeptide (TPR) repeat protein
LDVDRAILDEMQADLNQLSIWSREAHEAISQGRYEEARGLIKKIDKGFPDLVEAQTLLAKMEMARGHWSEAAEAYNYAIGIIERAPDSFDPQVLHEMRRGLETARSKAGVTGS